MSKDYKIAKQSLAKAIAERNEATLRLGLKKTHPSFKKEVIQAVRNTWFQSLLPDLIEILEGNQDFPDAKTSEQHEVEKAVVSAIMHFSGLRFSKNEGFSKNDIEKILEESRQWYRENEQEIQQTLTAELVER